MARVTFFSDDDSADQSASPSSDPDAPAAALETQAARDDSGPQVSNQVGESTALTGAAASACTSSEHLGNAAATTQDGDAANPVRGTASSPGAAKICIPSGGTDNSSGSASVSDGPHKSSSSQQQTDVERSGAPTAAKASGGAGSGTAVMYSAQLRQMARHVQITVKEWLVSGRIPVRLDFVWLYAYSCSSRPAAKVLTTDDALFALRCGRSP